MTVRIREMVPADTGQAARIEKQIITPPWTQADYLDALAKDSYLLLAAEDETGKLAGYCVASMAMDEAEIIDVGVAPDCQGCGAGSLLVREMLRRLHVSGITMVFLEVREHNGAAIRVYEKHGFKAVGRRKDFYSDPTEDAIIMKEETLC